jgi:hypothetical protein
MNNIIKELSEEQWNNIFNGYYKSIHELCLYIYICDFNMLNKHKLLYNFYTLNNKNFNHKYEYIEKIL